MSDFNYESRNRQQQRKKVQLARTASQLAEPQPESPKKFKKTLPVNTFVLEHTEELLKRNDVNRDDDRSSSLRCSASPNLSFETLSPSTIEQSTMTEEITGIGTGPGTGTMPDCKSVYQTALTDMNMCPKNIDLEILNAVGDPCYEKPGQISPYWDDPRLIEKYSKFLRPVQIRRSKSSWTLPLAINKQIPVSCTRVCPKCTCKCVDLNVKDGCTTYEESYEKTDSIVTCGKTKTKIYNEMFKNYCLSAFFLMGSVCGLMLVALVIWVLANDLLWSYLNRAPETQKYTGFRWLTAYIGGGILYATNFVFSKLYHMIVMPRNEVFDPTKSASAWTIF